jgi:hypothetical protein
MHSFVSLRVYATGKPDPVYLQPVQQLFIDVESHELKDRDRQGSYSFKKSSGITDPTDSVSELPGDQPYEVKVKTEMISVAR